MKAQFENAEIEIKRNQEIAEHRYQDLQNECCSQIAACQSAAKANREAKDGLIEQLRVQLETQSAMMEEYREGATAEVTVLRTQLQEVYQAAQSAVSQKTRKSLITPYMF